MKTKIKWFKEVLEMEPGSKVFFPLARLYFEDGRLDEAADALRHGLKRNPDHLEARLLLVDVLAGLDREDEAGTEVESITSMLSGYPAFWRVWAASSAPKSKDSALALNFLAAHFQGRSISWSDVIAEGLSALYAPAAGGVPEAASAGPGGQSADHGDAGPMSDEEAEANLRTRTMAELLAEQGDLKGALAIYEELLARGVTGDGLEQDVAEVRSRLGLPEIGSPVEPEAESATVAEPEAKPEVESATVADADYEEVEAGFDLESEPVEDIEAADLEAGFDLEAETDDEEIEVGFDLEAEEGDEAEDEDLEAGFDLEPEAEAEEPSAPSAVVDVPELPDFAAELLGAGAGDDQGVPLDLDATPEIDEEVVEAEAVSEAQDSDSGQDAEAEAEPVDAPAESGGLGSPLPGKEKLLTALEALAERLEARASV